MLKPSPIFFYVLLTLCANAACALLLWLARSGEGVAADIGLPLAVLPLMGVLFSSALFGLRRAMLERDESLSGVYGVALILNALLTYSMTTLWGMPLAFLIAPLTAVVLSELYTPLFREHAPMLAAMAVYIVCTLLATFTFDTFIALPVYGLLSVGTLFFGVTFTQRDRVHDYGRRKVYAMIFGAAVANFVMSMTLGIPLRFLLAGFLAIMLAEAADTEVYQRLLHRSWTLRVATSNAVSIPIDSVVFTAIAFAGVFSVAQMSEIVFADIIAKTVVGLLVALHIIGVRQPQPGTLPEVLETA